MNPRSGGLSVVVLLCLAPAARADPPALADRAQAVLKTHCHRCHGENGSAKGGFGYALDRDKLVARNKVVPGSPAESELYQRVQSGEMPPPGKGPRPGKDELLVLKQWIEAGAPGVGALAARREFVPDDAVRRL